MVKFVVFLVALSGAIAAMQDYWEWVAVVWTCLLMVIAQQAIDWRKDVS